MRYFFVCNHNHWPWEVLTQERRVFSGLLHIVNYFSFSQNYQLVDLLFHHFSWRRLKTELDYSRFTKKRNNLKYTTLGREPVSIVHYTRPGSSDPTRTKKLLHVKWPVFTLKVAPKSPFPSITGRGVFL